MSYDLVGASPIKLRDAQKFSDYINVTIIKTQGLSYYRGRVNDSVFSMVWIDQLNTQG